MTSFTYLKTEGNPAAAPIALLKSLLLGKRVDAVFVQAKTPYSDLPMPGLFANPDDLDQAAPLAPAAPFNAARHAARLLRHQTGRKVAVVLRPCEIRALIELVKLKQCTLDEAVLISFDCYGRMERTDFLAAAGDGFTNRFLESGGKGEMTATCASCDRFVPENVDLAFRLFGEPVNEKTGLAATSDAGRELLADMKMESASEPDHTAAIEAIMTERVRARDDLFEKTAAKTKDVESLQQFVSDCLNCLNCRVACPVCYCRECVFNTEVFDHEPETYFRRAENKGRIKMPTETTMYHLTRLAHMSHACVGCGQCSSVCPSDIPVADLFRVVAAKTQKAYDYIPGAKPEQPIPFLSFENQNIDGV